MWKEAVTAQFEVLLQHLSQGIMGNHKNSVKIMIFRQDLNLESPEYLLNHNIR
jgi:hypothetical protein